MAERIQLDAFVPATLAGKRLDQALAEMFPDYSRSRIQTWIRAGQVSVDGVRPRQRDPVLGGEHVRVDALLEILGQPVPQALPLTIVYEDDVLLIVNKRAGMVVHPGAGRPDGTLQNALLHYAPALAVLPRAGIVHRLDKGTTGLLAIAKTPGVHARLVDALQRHEITREYAAVCDGVLSGGGRIDAPLGRHAADRRRMCVRPDGRQAVTHYRVVDRFRAHTHVCIRLETGRTHQIRVHFAHIGFPLLGDPVYGRRPLLPKAADEKLIETIQGFSRQALHAAKLALAHPATGKPMEWTVPLPADMRQLIDTLAQDARRHGDA